MSEGNGNTITGVCIGVSNRNSLDGSFLVVFNLAGIPVRMRVKMYSPLLTEFELIQKGTGNLRVSSTNCHLF